MRGGCSRRFVGAADHFSPFPSLVSAPSLISPSSFNGAGSRTKIDLTKSALELRSRSMQSLAKRGTSELFLEPDMWSIAWFYSVTIHEMSMRLICSIYLGFIQLTTKRWCREVFLVPDMFGIFLVACTRLYKSLCWSVGRSVGPSVRHTVEF